MRLALHVTFLCYTSEESLRDSEPPLNGQGTGDFMRSECVKLVLV